MTAALFVAIGIGTWMLRASFLAGVGDPGRLARFRWLQRLVPAAVLAALTAAPLSGTDAAGGMAYLAAALLAGAAAWWTRNMAVTVTVGLLAMWLLGD